MMMMHCRDDFPIFCGESTLQSEGSIHFDQNQSTLCKRSVRWICWLFWCFSFTQSPIAMQARKIQPMSAHFFGLWHFLVTSIKRNFKWKNENFNCPKFCNQTFWFWNFTSKASSPLLGCKANLQLTHLRRTHFEFVLAPLTNQNFLAHSSLTMTDPWVLITRWVAGA